MKIFSKKLKKNSKSNAKYCLWKLNNIRKWTWIIHASKKTAQLTGGYFGCAVSIVLEICPAVLTGNIVNRFNKWGVMFILPQNRKCKSSKGLYMLRKRAIWFRRRRIFLKIGFCVAGELNRVKQLIKNACKLMLKRVFFG